MKKILSFRTILTIIVLAISSTAFCENVNVDKAQTIGKNFLQNSVSAFAGKTDINCQHVYTLKDSNGQPSLYVFNVENSGFVIVSAENCVSPILGYSTESSFNPDNISDGAAYLLSDYNATIEHVRNNKISASDEINEQWEMVQTIGRVTKEKNGKSVEPLCTTTWNQSRFYNEMCPEDSEGPGGHVYAGCVATAMSQVMKFWNFPAVGNGSHSYTPSPYPTQNVNFGETFYNFAIMPDYLDSTSSEAEINAIATFMWHCGVAVDMDYSAHGSGAFSNDVPDVVINNFFYQSSTHFINRSGNNWDQQLRNNLDDGMPIYYSGQDDNGAGGHAFVCDGYDNNNMFHFNLGWSGLDNGYYPSNAINTSHGPYYFNTWQGAIFDMAPNSAYVNKAISPTNFTITPAPNYGLSATLSWNNPTITMNAEVLSNINSIVIKRNNQVIETLTNIVPGETMTYTDNDISGFGSYSYTIYAVTDEGNGIQATKSVLIGPSCDITFNLHDSWGDGWNGASISVKNQAGAVLATVTLENGNSNNITLSLPTGTLQFYWVSGYYDSECSFQIFDCQNNQIYSTNNPHSGLFLTHDNVCQTDIQGDANSDSIVNISDITAIVAYVLGQNPDPFIFNNADYNSDGSIDILDIVAICNFIMSK